MQAVILAAGRGTRMKDLTDNVPKPMLKIKGRPILEYKLTALPPEIKEIVFVVGYKKSRIEEHFGSEFQGRKIRYAIQENLNGTGGAIHTARDMLGDKFMVMMGDDLYHPKDIREILANDLAILSAESDNPQNFGVFKINDDGHLLEILEKPQNPPTNLINAGLYILNKNFFDYDLVPVSGTEFGLPQTMAKMAKDHPIKIVKARAWHPIGNPDELKEAEKVLDKFMR
ncbi:MAG: sugar phosphate nucleotidyltransferase [Parcubacteria group bacterium]|nr:sugar phosphate nucleotidyltransferase [Candidatus Moranbacteria bacterium]